MKATLRCFAAAWLVAPCCFPASVVAFSTDWIGAVSSDFGNDNNWSVPIRPEAVIFDFARIGGIGQPGGVPNDPVVDLTSDLSDPAAPTIILGDGGGFDGTLNISGAGRLTIVQGIEATSGDLVVGRNGGVGRLNVSGTGQIDVADSLISGGAAESIIDLSGSASVATTDAALDRNLRVSGSTISFSASGNVTLGGSGTHEWEFDPATGTSALMVGGQLDLGGTLKIDSLGVPLTLGSSYVLADSASVANQFGAVDLTDSPSAGLGVRARVESVADVGSVNGVLTSLVVEQQPVLLVNRQTGIVTVRNPGSVDSVAIDAYIVGSDRGGLDASAWDSIAPDGGWDQANPTSQALSELNPLSSQALVGGEAIELGAIFDPVELAFGEDAEDVTFRFAPLGEGLTDGVVVYEGIPTDTLTLNVDRTTGSAQLINGFRDMVSIDTYFVSSESESLAVSPGGWEALGGDWDIGVNEAGRISELNPLGSLDLASNDAVSLGDLYAFDAEGAAEDLVFRFTLPTENFFRTGKVVFADELTILTPGLEGDANGDGSVDLLDLDILGANFGTSEGATVAEGDFNGDGAVDLLDLDILGSNFGQMAGGSAAAGSAPVPEPTCLLLAGLAFLPSARSGRRGGAL